MSKTGYLIKNTGILAIGSFSSKVLTFLLVPLYTAVLTAEEYGSYDILLSTVTLLIPILTLNIADAVLRFPLEEDADIPAIAHIGLVLTLLGSLVVLIASFIPNAPWGNVAGIGFFPYLFFAYAVYQLLIMLARGVEKMADVAVAGVVSTLCVVAFCILLLLVFQWGVDGFFIANIAGMLIPSAYLILKLRHVLFSRSKGGVLSLSKAMIKYAIPLSTSAIGWWFINTSGRYTVLAICGMAATGLLSIAYKIPAVLNAISGVFIQAWQVSAIKEFDKEDSDGFLRRAFGGAEAGLVIACSLLIMSAPLLAEVLFSGDFFSAWEFVPMLLISALLNTLGGLWGPFFSSQFDSLPVMIATFLGGAVSVALGIPLTMLLGVHGVTIAAALGSYANWLYRGIKARKHIVVSFHMGRTSLSCLVLAAQGIAMVAGIAPVVTIAIEIVLFVALIAMYRRDLTKMASSLARKVKSRGRG